MVVYKEEYIKNERGLDLFTCSWLPDLQEPTALILLCHGYAVECSVSMRGTGTRLAKAGFAVYGMDYEGHGKSSGLQGYIPCFQNLVNDCCVFYTRICEREENKEKKRFLLGESMGGAVALLLHKQQPTYWDGAVLVAPMCKIAREMTPHPLMIKVLDVLCDIIPTWKIIPTQDIIDIAIKDPIRREEIRSNPLCYKGRCRLKTGRELLMVSLDLENNLQQVSLPFLIVHGEEDMVTDSCASQLLLSSASSKDKTLKLYPGMWHALTSGETPENVDLVFVDILGWLNRRVQVSSETGLKSEHDDNSHAAAQAEAM